MGFCTAHRVTSSIRKTRAVKELPAWTLAGMAQLAGALSHNQRAVGSTPSQGTRLGCRFDTRSGGHSRK